MTCSDMSKDAVINYVFIDLLIMRDRDLDRPALRHLSYNESV